MHADKVQQAIQMLDVFASVGADKFDITHIDVDGKKRGFRAGRGLPEARESMRFLVPASFQRSNNLIVRPHANGSVQLVQLDDLDATALERVKPAAFLTLATSSGNHQAWIAVQNTDADFARRLRKGCRADPTASGATRVAGTLNYKRKYEPDFPTVTMLDAAPGHVVTREQLQLMRLVAAPEPVKPRPALRVSQPRRKAWPDYQRCIAGAPPNHGKTGPDVSRADFVWCMTALDWGWTVEQTSAKLMELSSKAQENGERYAELTATNALAAMMRNQQRGRG